jgi:hypothetical protein
MAGNMAGIPYKISIEIDNSRANELIQTKIINLLDGNHVHKMVSDICRDHGVTSCKVAIEIFVPPT